MKKEKKIWLFICSILCIGICITYYTNYKINLLKQSIGNQETAVVSAEPGTTENIYIAEDRSTYGESQYEVDQDKPMSEPVISPLETTKKENAEDQNNKTAYQKRLEELDLKITKMRSEESSSTPNAVKTVAQNELKLWESELDFLYSSLMKSLPKEEKENLISDEREWMKQRDSSAVAAAQKSSSGSMESLEYTTTLTKATRDRAYDLAEQYRDYITMN